MNLSRYLADRLKDCCELASLKGRAGSPYLHEDFWTSFISFISENLTALQLIKQFLDLFTTARCTAVLKSTSNCGERSKNKSTLT
jgi:hypothetical protein